MVAVCRLQKSVFCLFDAENHGLWVHKEASGEVSDRGTGWSGRAAPCGPDPVPGALALQVQHKCSVWSRGELLFSFWSFINVQHQVLYVKVSVVVYSLFLLPPCGQKAVIQVWAHFVNDTWSLFECKVLKRDILILLLKGKCFPCPISNRTEKYSHVIL